MSKVTVGRWGKSLAVRIPNDIIEAAGLKDGERVEIEARDDGIVIRRLVPRISVEEMFKDSKPGEWREAYKGAFDWGPDLGREKIDD